MSATKAPHSYKTFFISSLPLDFLRIKMLRLLRTEFCDTSATIREKYSILGRHAEYTESTRGAAAHCTNVIFFPIGLRATRLVGSTTTTDSEKGSFSPGV